VTTEYVDENKKKIFEYVKEHNNSKDTLHIIISYGVAENRENITLETLCENYIYDLMKDKIINENNPEYFYSKAAIKTLVKGINKTNELYCKYSCDAGTYLCNYMYYSTVDNYKNDDNVMSLFVHIPKIQKCSIQENEKFFKCLIHSLEICYLKGNEKECEELIKIPNKKEDMNIDEWEKNKNYDHGLFTKL
jgi:pyrrolidone-carboxylate peptidase